MIERSQYNFPDVLREGDMVRVIAPSLSLGIIGEEVRRIANERLLNDMGLHVTYGRNSCETDSYSSSSVASRIKDIHEAFTDPDVKGIFSAIGGYNSNQLLDYIDWSLVEKNQKVFCGFSDVNAIGNAALRMSGLVTYSGPHYSSFGQKSFDSYTTDYLRRALFERETYTVLPSLNWTDDETWFLDQDNRQSLRGEGYWPIQTGHAEGTIIGGNLCTINLLQGTKFFPKSDSAIAFIEDTSDSNLGLFDRNLQSLLHAQPLKGVIIGRFQNRSEVGHLDIVDMISRKAELADIPVAANVDFGHTFPMTTFPIGGRVVLRVTNTQVEIDIINKA